MRPTGNLHGPSKSNPTLCLPVFQSYTLIEDPPIDLIANFGLGKMNPQASGVRTRLHSLLRTLVFEDRNPIYSVHGQVRDWFLSENGIRLVPHEFDNTENSAVTNLSHDPPILFSPLPLETFEKYPILGPEAYPNPKVAEVMLAYSDSKKIPKLVSLSSRVSFTLHFLERWAGGFSRKGTSPEFIHLRELPGLTRVR